MFIFNLLTPMVSDDFAHYYGTEDEHPRSLSEILRNMVHFRTNINGRVVSHFFVYLFLSLPRIVFQLLNAVISCLVLFFMSRFFICKKNSKDLIVLVFSATAIWVFTPSFGEIYLWLSGAINYSWGLALDLLLIYPFFCAYLKRDCKILHHERYMFRICYLVLAFIVGSYSENGATATICVIGFLGLLIWIQEKKLPVFLFFVFLCTCAGYLFLLTAPATLNTRVGGDIREHIWYCRVLTVKYMTVLFLIYILLLVVAVISKVNKKVIVFSLIMIIASVLSICVFVFAIYLPARSFMIAVSFTILADSCLLSKLLERKQLRFLFVVPVTVSIAFCILFPRGTKDVIYLYNLQKERKDIIEETIDHNIYDVILPRFVTLTDYTACPEEELSDDSSYWYNELLARYYGVNSIVAKSD